MTPFVLPFVLRPVPLEPLRRLARVDRLLVARPLVARPLVARPLVGSRS